MFLNRNGLWPQARKRGYEKILCSTLTKFIKICFVPTYLERSLLLSYHYAKQAGHKLGNQCTWTSECQMISLILPALSFPPLFQASSIFMVLKNSNFIRNGLILLWYKIRQLHVSDQSNLYRLDFPSGSPLWIGHQFKYEPWGEFGFWNTKSTTAFSGHSILLLLHAYILAWYLYLIDVWKDHATYLRVTYYCMYVLPMGPRNLASHYCLKCSGQTRAAPQTKGFGPHRNCWFGQYMGAVS